MFSTVLELALLLSVVMAVRAKFGYGEYKLDTDVFGQRVRVQFTEKLPFSAKVG
tara:strand:- start:309 stop:470 length:162 start_codon:yes stop_codon:yes gene_type:complete